MERTRFEEIRRNVLDKFNNLEMLMNLAINLFYFKRIEKDFLFRVLHDSLFSTALRINVFTKIVNDSDKKRFEHMESAIRQMSNIRNYFAHITPQYFDSEEPSLDKVGYFPDPKDPKKKIDLEKEHEKFFELEKEVNPYVIHVCTILGLKFPIRF